jgi:hypothetical protein
MLTTRWCSGRNIRELNIGLYLKEKLKLQKNAKGRKQKTHDWVEISNPTINQLDYRQTSCLEQVESDTIK